MAISTVTEPTGLVPAYEKDALLYEWKEAFDITGSANDSGDLQLTVGASAVAELSVGDYIYVSPLDGEDFVDTAVQEVKSLGATTVTIDFSFQSIASGGEIRLMTTRAFIIDTGIANNTDQPLRRSYFGLITPNPQGLYRLDGFKAAISRFRFNIGPESKVNDVSHYTKLRAYEAFETPPSYVTPLKQNEGTTPALPIIYEGRRNIISDSEGSKYATYFESTSEINVDPIAQDYRYYANKTVTVNFNTTIQDANTTITPGLPSYATLITSNTGQTIDGFTLDLTQIDASETTGLEITFTEDDGINPPVEYNFTFYFYDFLESRPICGDKSLRLYWWSPQGGWVSYSFELLKEYSLDENNEVLAENNGSREVVAYENQRQAITLYASPERLAVLDYLNTMFESTEHYVQINPNLSGSNFERYFISGESRGLKGIDQYRPNQNRFQVTIIKSAENRPINQD